MARGITLTKSEVLNVDFVWAGAFRLRVDASLPSGGMDERVFLWQRNPMNPFTSEETDVFITVCSPVDLSEYPPEEPDPTADLPYFRRSWVELDFRAVSQADEGWQAIQNAVLQLVEALNKLDTLTPTEVVRIGSEDEESSLSDSESM